MRETKTLAILSFVFLVAQALMGAAAVVWGQMPAVLAIHFGISLISFASVILLTCLIFEIDQKFDARSLIMDKNEISYLWCNNLQLYRRLHRCFSTSRTS